MFGFIKKVFLAMTFFSFNILSVNSFKCISMKNQECKIREVVKNNKYMTYSYSIKVNRGNGNCNNISDPYSRVHIPDVIKNISVKVFDLVPWTNNTKQVK